MHLIASYDISNDKQRTRLFRRLQDYGHPVLKSVFEFSIPKALLDEVRSIIIAHLDPATDSARLYTCCKSCRDRVEVLGQHRGPDEIDPECYVI